MGVKKNSKKRVTITFQPDDEVLALLGKNKIQKRERSRVINQALKEAGPEVIKRSEAARRVFEGASDANKSEGTR